MSIVAVQSPTLGEGWLDVTRAILDRGAQASYDGQRTRELALVSLVVERPSSADETIARLGDPEWLAWMHESFFVHKDVAELGHARSYAVRLFDRLQEHVAGELEVPIGRLVVHAKSAHVYEPEWAAMAEIAGIEQQVGRCARRRTASCGRSTARPTR
jgi:hypothetical protein